jgi:hypothetical protein
MRIATSGTGRYQAAGPADLGTGHGAAAKESVGDARYEQFFDDPAAKVGNPPNGGSSMDGLGGSRP